MKRSIFKTALLSAISTLCVFGGTAQERTEKETAFSFTFIYPLSTNGMRAAEYSNGVSVNLLAGISRNERNFTLSGLGAVASGRMTGLHVAGIFNTARQGGRGAMISGVVNTTGGRYSGFQLAGVGNVARDVNGFQLGGVFNVAKRVRGVQLAAVVNIAESSDAPIALVNIIKEGEYGIGVTYSDMGSIVAQFRSGGRITYGILGFGYNHKSNDKGYVIEGGLGANINITEWLRIKNEVKAGAIGGLWSKSFLYGNYSLMPSFRVTRCLEVFGGPSINYIYSDDTKRSNLFPKGSLWKKHTAKSMKQIYIGYQAGVQFIL